MKSILLALAMLFSSVSFAQDKTTAGPVEPVAQETQIVLSEGNFFPITTPFNFRLLDDFTEKVLTHQGDKMKIVIDSPGGSVIALSRMARIMKSSNIEFTCIASFAASAAFMLFEHCDNRYILSDGILMSHNWSGAFRGEAPRIMTLFLAIQSLVDDLEKTVIDKMDVDSDEYAALINSNLWMPASLAVKYGAVDKVVNGVTCDKVLINQRIPLPSRRSGFYRTFSQTYYKSGCPLIQKLYTKSKAGTFVETSLSLFEYSQKTYRPEQANLIYMGTR